MAAPTKSKAKAASTKPKYAVVGDTFVAQTEEGEIKIRLRFKTKLVRQIRAGDGDELDQFFMLLDGIGDTATIAQLDELDIFETGEIANRFFEEWAARQDAALGESSGSSSSSRSTDQPSGTTSDTASD